MRRVVVDVSQAESPLERFRADQLMIARCGADGRTARIRVHDSARPGVALGRFARMAPGSPDLQRRLTGGRAVPIGPGFLEVSVAVPAAEWFEPGGPALSPEQTLNRSVRPLLGALRASGVDVFYPGRDLLTVDGKTVAMVSFTRLPDGVIFAEQVVALETPFAVFAERIAAADPAGIAAADPAQFADSVALRGAANADWQSALADAAGQAWKCPVERGCDSDDEPGFVATEEAKAAFDAELGPPVEGRATAIGFTMLGVLEAAARIEDGRIYDFEMSGDFIAPFSTPQEMARRLEGEPAVRAAVDRVYTNLVGDRGHFLLGVTDPASVIERLA